MRLVVIIALSIFMFSCSVAPQKIDVPNIDKSSLVLVKDVRPESEKEREIFSAHVFKEEYGINRVGDQVITPGPMRLFQHRIYEKYQNESKLPKVTVYHFVVYSNMTKELKRMSAGIMFGGVLGALVGSIGSDSTVSEEAKLTTEEDFNSVEKEYYRGFYTEEENPDGASIFKVYIDAELDGERKFISLMAPTKLEEGDERPPYVVAIERAIKYYLEQYE